MHCNWVFLLPRNLIPHPPYLRNTSVLTCLSCNLLIASKFPMYNIVSFVIVWILHNWQDFRKSKKLTIYYHMDKICKSLPFCSPSRFHIKWNDVCDSHWPFGSVNRFSPLFINFWDARCLANCFSINSFLYRSHFGRHFVNYPNFRAFIKYIFHCYFSFTFFVTVCRLLVSQCVYRSFRLVRFTYLRCCFQFVLSLSRLRP